MKKLFLLLSLALIASVSFAGTFSACITSSTYYDSETFSHTEWGKYSFASRAECNGVAGTSIIKISDISSEQQLSYCENNPQISDNSVYTSVEISKPDVLMEILLIHPNNTTGAIYGYCTYTLIGL